MVRVEVAVRVKPVRVAPVFRVSKAKTLVPEPSCSTRAVPEAMFSKSPPAPVKPERKAAEELLSWKRLAEGEAAACKPSPILVAAPWVSESWPMELAPTVRVSVVVAALVLIPVLPVVTTLKTDVPDPF